MTLHGANLQSQDANSVLDWLFKNTNPLQTTCTALIHTDEGVTWGIFSNEQWKFSSQTHPEISPTLTEHNLTSARIFNSDIEYLVWRTTNGFSARSLTDAPIEHDWQKPLEENMIVLGNQYEPTENEFIRLAENNGRRHAVPNLLSASPQNGAYPLQLTVKHYLEEDTETGVLRIKVTRVTTLNLRARGNENA
jgi:CRISPR-associated protein (TIGR03984 family)